MGECHRKILVLGGGETRALGAGDGGRGAAGRLLGLEVTEDLQGDQAAAVVLVHADAVGRMHALIVQLFADVHLRGAPPVVETHKIHLLEAEEARHNLREPMEEHLGRRLIFPLDRDQGGAVPGGPGEKLAQVGDQQRAVEEEGAGKIGSAEIIQQLVEGGHLHDRGGGDRLVVAELPAPDLAGEQKGALPFPEAGVEQQPGVGGVALQGDRPQLAQFRVPAQGVLIEGIAAGPDEVSLQLRHIRDRARRPTLGGAEGLHGQLEVLEIILALLDVRADGGEQQVLDLHVEAAGDLDEGVEERADLLGLVGHHLKQAGRGEAEDLERDFLQNPGLQHAGERMEFFPEVEGNEVVEADAERLGQGENFTRLGIFFPFFDFTEVGDGQARAVGELLEREGLLLAELVEFQAENEAQILLHRKLRGGGGRRGRRRNEGGRHGERGAEGTGRQRPDPVAGWSGVDKEVGEQLVRESRVVGVAAEIRPAAGAEKILIQEGLAGERLIGGGEDFEGGIGHDVGRATARQQLGPNGKLDGGGGDGRARPERGDGNFVRGELTGHPERQQGHAEFGQGIRCMRRQPFRPEIERRRQTDDMTAAGPAQQGEGGLGANEHGAGIHLLHEIVPLDRRVGHVGELDRAGVVDQGVELAEFLFDGGHQGGDLKLIPDVDLQRQCPNPAGPHFLSHGMDGAGQLGVRFGGLGRNDDIRAFPGRGECDGPADAPAGAGDEDRAVEETFHGKMTPCIGGSCANRRRKCRVRVKAAATSPVASAREISKSRSTLFSCTRAARRASISRRCRRTCA